MNDSIKYLYYSIPKEIKFSTKIFCCICTCTYFPKIYLDFIGVYFLPFSLN
ncbi:hypothetical protein M23134_04288 [Microscilla marina ATCC 23134]|uniref:Uncharacterized protein n=1 Tax=Microscilla marina ATCC 23134 TaxID=313606 RepID=A1ZEE7_MICM2|nr:hypothetical protein M23134_04288 [Microscilla marina ATCC 23134]